MQVNLSNSRLQCFRDFCQEDSVEVLSTEDSQPDLIDIDIDDELCKASFGYCGLSDCAELSGDEAATQESDCSFTMTDLKSIW